jgi:hypothetical protein
MGLMKREEWIVWWLLMGGAIATIILANILFPYVGWLSWVLTPLITPILVIYIMQAVRRLIFRNPRGPN